MKIEVSHLIRFASAFSGIEVHLFVGGKYIKMNYSNEQFVDILRKLQQKDVREVYIKPEDCQNILNRIEETMFSKSFFDPSTMPEQRMQTTEAATEVVKQMVAHLGADEETVKLLNTINSRAMSIISESPTIFAYVQRFKESCSEEYLRSTLTSYMMGMLIDKFGWSSEQVKEKGALASILCDMVLVKEDFKKLRDWEKLGLDLPEHVRNHPAEVVRILKLKRTAIPNETLTIIEQHHELPNGKGFPHGIVSSRFNNLACIFILSQQFVELLFEENFNFQKRLQIIDKLQSNYGCKNFEQAMGALIAVVGK